MATYYPPSEYVFTSNPVPIKITGLTTGEKVKVEIRDNVTNLLLGTFYFYERSNEANFDLSGILNDLTAKYFTDYAVNNSILFEGQGFRQLKIKITNNAGTTTYTDSIFICIFGGKQIADQKEYRCGNVYGMGNWLIEHKKIEWYPGTPLLLSFISAFSIVPAANSINVVVRVKQQLTSTVSFTSFPVTISKARSLQIIDLRTLFNGVTTASDCRYYEIEIMWGNHALSIVKPIRVYNTKESLFSRCDVHMFRWVNKLGGYDHAYLFEGSDSISIGTESANVFIDSIEPTGNRFRSTHEVRTKTARKTKKYGVDSIDYATWLGHIGIAESISVQIWNKDTELFQNVEIIDSSFSWDNNKTLNNFECTVLFPQEFTQVK